MKRLYPLTNISSGDKRAVTWKITLSLFSLCLLFISSPAEAYTPEKVKYAEHFSIEYKENGVKIVTESRGKRLLLVPRGKHIPAEYRRSNMPVVRTPVKRAMLCSTTYVSFLRFLDEKKSLYSSIAAVTMRREKWTDETIREMMGSGKISYFPYIFGQKLGAEGIIAYRPEIVFTSDKTADVSRIDSQLEAAGIISVCIDNYMEKSDNAYLEWLKFFGAFYNMDEEGDIAFRKNKAEMDRLKSRITELEKNKKLSRPSVAVGSFFKGIYLTKPGNSKYKNITESAGGKFLPDEAVIFGENGRLTPEKFLESCKNADILIYRSTDERTPSMEALLAQSVVLKGIKAVKENNVYVLDRGYYMNAAEVVEKFKDLVFIFHPGLMPGHKLRHFRKLK